jgi:hypothetical protein
MNYLIDKISNELYDITYIAIGSAFISNIDNPENRQQFPEFLEYEYEYNNRKIRIINIDPTFEKPYFMKRYLPNLIQDDTITNELYDRFYSDNLEVLYISNTINLDNSTFLLLDTINKIIMDYNNILIVSDFTGRDFIFIEKYFYNLYKNTIYELKFNNLICYDFIIDACNTCNLNMINNYPIIENNLIEKFNFINEYDFLIKIKNKKLNHIHKKIFIKNFHNFINENFYIYRNLINKNISQHIKNIISKSIFIDIDLDNYSSFDITEILTNKLLLYNDIIYQLFGINNYLLYLINKINIMDAYKLYDNFISLNKNLNNFIKN